MMKGRPAVKGVSCFALSSLALKLVSEGGCSTAKMLQHSSSSTQTSIKHWRVFRQLLYNLGACFTHGK